MTNPPLSPAARAAAGTSRSAASTHAAADRRDIGARDLLRWRSERRARVAHAIPAAHYAATFRSTHPEGPEPVRFQRSSGLLLHPTALPGRSACGDLGPGADAFVDFL